MKAKATIQFKSKVLFPESGKGKGGSDMFIILPKSAVAKLPLKKAEEKIKLEGVVNNFPFRIPLALDKNGNHILKISKALLGAARAQVGEIATVEIMLAGDEEETRIPSDLSKALAGSSKAKALWEDITAIARRDWIYWVATAKQLETRQRRVEGVCDRLENGKRRVCCFEGVNWMMKNYS